MAANKSATPAVPAIVHTIRKSADPKELVLNLIDLFTYGTPYKWASTSWASEIPTLNGTKKFSLNDVYRKMAEQLGFAPEDRDPVAVTTRLAGEGVIVSRWFQAGSKSVHKITKADPNYTKATSKQAATNDF